jgi:RHS repeat-associated protein
LQEEESLGRASYLLGDGPTQRFARLGTTANGSGDGFFVQDRRGNVAEIADIKLGNSLAKYTYDGFGNTTTVSEATVHGRQTTRNGFGFTGLRQGPAGTTQAHWRSYDSTSGTWQQEDPISFSAGDANIRRYVGNDPVNYTDPSGLDSWWDDTWLVRGADRTWDTIQWPLGNDKESKRGREIDQDRKDLDIGKNDKRIGATGFWSGSVEGAEASYEEAKAARLRKVDQIADQIVKAGELHDKAAGYVGDLISGDRKILDDAQSVVKGHLHLMGRLATDQQGIVDDVVGAAAKLAQAEIDRFNKDPGGYLIDRGLDVLIAIASGRALQALLGPNCFPAGTLVGTESGLKPIEEILANDLVWAFDHIANSWKLRSVVETFSRIHAGHFIRTLIEGESIECTLHHPWWIVRGEQLDSRPRPDHVPRNPEEYQGEGRWVDAIDLRVGDMVILRSGKQASISEISVFSAQQMVYNFHVEELQCYAVGYAQILVHNNSYLLNNKSIAGKSPSRIRSDIPKDWKLHEAKGHGWKLVD